MIKKYCDGCSTHITDKNHWTIHYQTHANKWEGVQEWDFCKECLSKIEGFIKTIPLNTEGFNIKK